MRVVYIGSQSRSGSTICDLIIGQIPSVVSLGELKVFDREMGRGAKCSCGAEPCGVMTLVRQRLRDRLGDTLEQVEGRYLRMRSLPVTAVSKQRRRAIKDYFCALHDVLEETMEQDCYVDSSKCPVRKFWYDRYFKGDLLYVRLVRRPSAVAASLSRPWGKMDQSRGQQTDFFGQSKAVTYAGWMFSNAMFNGLAGAPDITIDYDRMTRDPERLQSDVGRALGLDAGKAGKALRDKGHITAGSRWRLQRDLEVRPATGPAPSFIDRWLMRAFVRTPR